MFKVIKYQLRQMSAMKTRYRSHKHPTSVLFLSLPSQLLSSIPYSGKLQPLH